MWGEGRWKIGEGGAVSQLGPRSRGGGGGFSSLCLLCAAREQPHCSKSSLVPMQPAFRRLQYGTRPLVYYLLSVLQKQHNLESSVYAYCTVASFPGRVHGLGMRLIAHRCLV